VALGPPASSIASAKQIPDFSGMLVHSAANTKTT
jgi:hypothetical protein